MGCLSTVIDMLAKLSGGYRRAALLENLYIWKSCRVCGRLNKAQSFVSLVKEAYVDTGNV